MVCVRNVSSNTAKSAAIRRLVGMDTNTEIDLKLDELLRSIEAGTLARDTDLAYAVTYHGDGLLVHPAWRGTLINDAA